MDVYWTFATTLWSLYMLFHIIIWNSYLFEFTRATSMWFHIRIDILYKCHWIAFFHYSTCVEWPMNRYILDIAGWRLVLWEERSIVARYFSLKCDIKTPITANKRPVQGQRTTILSFLLASILFFDNTRPRVVHLPTQVQILAFFMDGIFWLICTPLLLTCPVFL